MDAKVLIDEIDSIIPRDYDALIGRHEVFAGVEAVVFTDDGFKYEIVKVKFESTLQKVVLYVEEV